MERTARAHMLKIARDTVKNPSLALLGGPSVQEARDILLRFGTEADKRLAKAS